MTVGQYTLSELGALIRGCLQSGLDDGYWVTAEVISLQVRSGHCYLDLVEKGYGDGMFVARMRAIAWARTWSQIEGKFRMMSGQTLMPGMKVLLYAGVQFNDSYGLSLIVKDIDPSYTLGDIARRRMEIMRRLEEDGIKDMNKELEMPLLPQRIAVISSQTAAGYQDFCKQLDEDIHHYYFETTLFPALMQGEHTEKSVGDALDRIFSRYEDFDVVVIIRGGGATTDLMAFDSYELAQRVAQFPLPVITGIGHERDDTVLDMVSHTRVKTPTAAAEFLIARVDECGQKLDLLENALVDLVIAALQSSCAHLEIMCHRLGALVDRKLSRERERFSQLAMSLPLSYSGMRQKEQMRLSRLDASIRIGAFGTVQKSGQREALLASRLISAVQRVMERRGAQLDLIAQRIEDNSPEKILKRGYSITTLEGKAVRNRSQLRKGDRIITRLADGEVSSIVE